MDIRTKLVFTLVAVSLGSMLILGAMTYSNARSLLTESTLDQLQGLADTNRERVEELVSRWRDRVSMAARRLELVDGAPPAVVLESEDTFVAVALYDARGRLLASAARDDVSWVPPDSSSAAPATIGEPLLVGTIVTDGSPRITFEAPVTLETGEPGILRVTMDGRELSGVTNDRGGLGETGEVLVVGRVESGVARVLTPLRHAAPGGSEVRRPDDPATLALTGEEGEFVEGMVDYRGEPVWAAIRYLPDAQWGLVVKFDAAEELASIDRFRADLTEVGTVLAAFAVVLGIAVGLRFAKPIHDLAAVATRIRNGELDARASVKREDEIGLFARTFNDMTDELERRMTLLLEFKKFFDVSLDMLCIAGTDGYFKRLNPAFEKTLGWTTEQLVDQPFNELIHPDDIDATNHEIEKLSQGIPTISFLNRFRCSNGEYKLLMWTSHPEPETGLLYAVARDMTGQVPS